jgi:flagellar biosynthetic protein FliR
MPIYAMILIVNIVLGIMAKVAPQMNMFVVGMQLKVLAGLAVLTLVMQLLPGVSDYIIKEMVKIMRLAVEAIR